MRIVIDIPDNYMDCIDNYEKGSLFDVALTNAIKNGTPLESCDNAINRQAVLDLVYADWKYEGLESPIENLPPVTPVPKTGHWIIIDDCELFMAKCSECGEIVDSRMINKYPYCHCGARMKETEE